MASDGIPTWTTFAANTRWKAGSSTGFSTPPTMAQINASSDIAQIVGFLNRKQSQLNGATALGYLPALVYESVTAAYMANIQTCIDNLRSYIGMSAFSWANTPTQGKPLHASWLTQCQTALTLTRTKSLSIGRYWLNSGGVYPAYGATDTYSNLNITGANVGKQQDALHPTKTFRSRVGVSALLPTIGTSADAVLHFSKFLPTNGETNKPRVYASSTDDSAYTGHWETNLNNLVGDGTYGSGVEAITVSNAILAGRSGAQISFIIGIDTEMTDTGVGLINAGYEMIDSFDDVNAVLTINY